MSSPTTAAGKKEKRGSGRLGKIRATARLLGVQLLLATRRGCSCVPAHA
jgi:hypothetical protein